MKFPNIDECEFDFDKGLWHNMPGHWLSIGKIVRKWVSVSFEDATSLTFGIHYEQEFEPVYSANWYLIGYI